MPTAATQVGGRMASALLQGVATSLGCHPGRPTDNLTDPTGTSCPRSSCTERRPRQLPGIQIESRHVFELDQVVPWGRSFDEYVRMFTLSDEDLGRTILGCGDGPASFNAEATQRGHRVVSCDPLYRFTREDIERRIAAIYDQVIDQARRNADDFVWGQGIQDIDELGAVRTAAMQTFLADYERGKRDGRYLDASLPALPFDSRSFDLALCSHFLFLYSGHLDEPFHHEALLEMSRVAAEVRVFPLLSLGGTRSPFVDGCVARLVAAGCRVTIETVQYEFQRGGNEMMRISRGGLPS
jgi:hypothetical protein